ncbi:rsbT co-antagonist protein RsbR [Halobacillus alkaliphilus]|uniref:RsbT co-antagonist protein RsbR n=1 Tax=Halobacillus alkaliphilus TaxID=396056 RepID=A0A1I2LVX9_9BACI|nr:STAS domain-containing protein [Halobacillus alkaliphilus]SFF83425.1 rsbT co-antagonist protein RsbR [Halobacillus alkaliphilus]
MNHPPQKFLIPRNFQDFEEVAKSIIELMDQSTNLDTLFFTSDDGETCKVIQVASQKEPLVSKGETFPLDGTLCKRSLDHGKKAYIISDLTKEEKGQAILGKRPLEKGSFIAVPIFYKDGSNYGTICGLHSEPTYFSRESIELFETMASLLTYVLELERAKEQINQLSAPLVPITESVAILPVIGEISEERADMIIQMTLQKSQEWELDDLVIDLSGISVIDETVGASLLKIVNILKLIGVTPVITGMQPDLAVKAVDIRDELKEVDSQPNLGSALKKLGFSLKRNE